MVSVVGLLGLVVIVLLNTAIAAVGTRLLRVRLESEWGPVVYAVILIPVVLVFTTLVLSGVFGLGSNLGDPWTVVFVVIAIPLVLGVTIDYVWMPPPEEVDLPKTA